MRDDHSSDRFGPDRIRQADHGGISHFRMFEKSSFHLLGGNILTPCFDKIFGAIYKVNIPLFIHANQIAGVMPAPTECLQGFFFIFVITEHNGGATGNQFPDFTTRDLLIIQADDFQLKRQM